MELTNPAMLRLHVEAVWGVKLPPLEQAEVSLLQGSAQLNWRLYVADMAEGQILIWRADLGPGEREELLARLEWARSLPEGALPVQGVSHEVALRQAAAPAMDLGTARQIARQLTIKDYELIEAFWPGEAEKMFQPEPQPLLGVVVAGCLLSLAHSSRRTEEACELGIETLSEARRKGYALAATVAWTVAIRAEGLIPIYSAFAENSASLRLAAASGYREFVRATMVG